MIEQMLGAISEGALIAYGQRHRDGKVIWSLQATFEYGRHSAGPCGGRVRDEFYLHPEPTAYMIHGSGTNQD